LRFLRKAKTVTWHHLRIAQTTAFAAYGAGRRKDRSDAADKANWESFGREVSHADRCNILVDGTDDSQPGANYTDQDTDDGFFHQTAGEFFNCDLVPCGFKRSDRQRPCYKLQRRPWSRQRRGRIGICRGGSRIAGWNLYHDSRRYAVLRQRGRRNGTYTASVSNVSGATATGATLLDAENNLTIRIDELV
jgi:hypothetical protein